MFEGPSLEQNFPTPGRRVLIMSDMDQRVSYVNYYTSSNPILCRIYRGTQKTYGEGIHIDIIVVITAC